MQLPPLLLRCATPTSGVLGVLALPPVRVHVHKIQRPVAAGGGGVCDVRCGGVWTGHHADSSRAWSPHTPQGSWDTSTSNAHSHAAGQLGHVHIKRALTRRRAAGTRPHQTRTHTPQGSWDTSTSNVHSHAAGQLGHVHIKRALTRRRAAGTRPHQTCTHMPQGSWDTSTSNVNSRFFSA
jgi:hypothetical protein